MTKRKELTYSDLTIAARNLLSEIVAIASSHPRYCPAGQEAKDNFGYVMMDSSGFGIALALFPDQPEKFEQCMRFLECATRFKNTGYRDGITDAGLAKIHGKVEKALDIWSVLNAKQVDLFEYQDQMAA